MLEEIRSEQIFPVHTEHADLFAKFVRDLRSKVVLPKKERTYRI
jgi:mRNA degradation ribonuclease J1/J2